MEIKNNFTSVLSAVIEKYAPIAEKRASNKHSPWLSSELKSLSKTQDKIKIAAVKNKSENLMSAYRQSENGLLKGEHIINPTNFAFIFRLWHLNK